MASTTFESTTSMNEASKSALHDLLVACADTKLLLGYHYGEWTFGPPELEAGIACCSLCQTELGHVRLLHGILNTHFGEDIQTLVDTRSAEDFANISYLDNELQDWSEFVAANYVVDMAMTLLLDGMRASTFKPLHASLAKMLQEERYHIHHGQGWFRSLAAKNDATREAIISTTKRAIASVMTWFGPPESPEDNVLVAAGIKRQSNTQTLQRLLAEIAKLARQVKIDCGITKSANEFHFDHEEDWKNWQSKTRRCREGMPCEEILYHLRGSKNQVFKLG